MSSGRVGDGITVMDLLWWLGNGRGQLYLPSGDVGRSRPLSIFTSSMILMMTRRGPAIYRRPRWWRRQGPTITQWLAMMVMRMSGRPWRPDIRRPRRDTARPRTTRRISLPPGAGPSRWRGPGPLTTLSTSTVLSGRMMGPWRVMPSVGPVRSSTALPTPWPVAFRPLGPRNTVGPRPSHHGHAGRHGLLRFTGSEGRPAESASVALDPDSVAVFVLFFLDDPSLLPLEGGSWRASSGACISTELSIISLLGLLSRLRCSRCLAFAFLLDGFLLSLPGLRQPILADFTGRVFSAKCEALV